MSTALAVLLDSRVRHERVCRVVRRVWGRQQASEAALCVGLRRLYRDNVHRGGGRARFEDWAEANLGIPRKLAALFSWIGAKLERLPKTLAALDCGVLGYSKVREFVNLATPEDEADWIEYARSHTNRDLESRVRRRTHPDDRETSRVVSKLTGPERQAVRKARDVLEKREGRRIPPRKLLAEMARAVAQSGRNGTDAGAPAPMAPDERSSKPPVYVAIQPCPICLDTFVPVPEGVLRTPIREWVEAVAAGARVVDLTDHYLCDCEGERHRRDRCPNWSPTEPPAVASRYIRAEWSRAIRARDGFVCRVPGCRNEVPLHASHLRPFRDGAPATPENLRQHCATCNALLESGALRVVGAAPYERYYDADGCLLGYGYDRIARDGAPGVSHGGNGAAGTGEGSTGPPGPPEGGSETA